MSLAYLDTQSGIAGDMLLSALVDAGADKAYIGQQVSSLPGLEHVELDFSQTQRHCFRALMLDVRHPAEHAHRHLSDIEAMLTASRLTPREQDMALRVFRRLGAAEAKVHGLNIAQVHFHEVGAIDSIVDIAGIAVALCNLQISRMIASPTPTGCGTIQIAHGLVSVPAPATAELLRGIPIRGTNIESELTTPTGAAVLATLVDGFGPLPEMQIARIGYGAGHKELAEQANLLRVLIGTPLADDRDDVVVLETNLDDVSGEQLGFAIEQLWQQRPLDVFTTAIGMKKNRPATLLSVICRPEQRGSLEECLFRNTGSLGIRRSRMSRRKLQRQIIKVPTSLGAARVKIAWLPGMEHANGDPENCLIAPEYDDCRHLALESATTLEHVFELVRDAATQELRHRSMRATPPVDRAGPADHAHEHHHDHAPHHHDHPHDH